MRREAIAIACLSIAMAFVSDADAQSGVSGRKVIAWGSNLNGQLNVPEGLTNVVAVSASGQYALALKADGSVEGWGQNGQNPPSWSETNAIAISSSKTHSLVLLDDGTVRTLGFPSYPQPPDLTNIIAIAAGANHDLALRADRSVVAWGNAGLIPTDATNVVAIAAGTSQSLALRSDGTVVGWSGNGPATNIPPNVVDVTAVAAGEGFSLALKADGTVVAWGSGTAKTNVPPNLADVTKIAAGSFHSLAIKSDGTVVSWGLNQSGQTNVPPDLPFAIDIAGGFLFSVALVDPNHAVSPPFILRHPRNQTVTVGSTVLFNTKALSAAPMRYQWYLNETNVVTGATNEFLYFEDLRVSQSGYYHVVISNEIGSTSSAPALLTVLPALGLFLVPAINVLGDVGSSYRIEFVSVFGEPTNWSAITTLTLTNNPQLYLDFEATNQPRRFYRIVPVQ